MKKSVILIFFIFATLGVLQAQSRLGLRASGTITSLTTADATSRFGFKAGPMLSTPLSDHLYFQPSLLLSLNGSKAADKYKPDYSGYTYGLELPVMFSIRGGDHDLSIGLDFGGFARYDFAGNYWTDSAEGRIRPDVFDYHKKFNFGPQIGFSVMIERWYIGCAFQYGVLKSWSDKKGQPYSYGLNLAYLFELY